MSGVDTLSQLLEAGRIRLRPGELLSAQPPALAHDERLRDRVAGMLLGLAIGDALGNTSEGMRPADRRAMYGEVRGYLPNRYTDWREAGLPSDDTQLAFRTLEQALADGALVPERLARRFLAQPIFGLGYTVATFLERLRSGRPWYACGPHSAGNGALMRIAPVLVPHLEAPSAALWADTALAAMLTHNDGASNAACVAYVAMLWELLASDAPPQPRWWLERFLELARELEPGHEYVPRGGRFRDYRGPLWGYVEQVVPQAWEAGASTADACEGWHSGAYLLETVPSVLYILMRHGHDPEQALVRAVNDTVDNDTIGAIVGAAAGALHGRSKLPRRWLDGLLGRIGEDDDARVQALVEAALARWIGP